jgi:hypothetical protein
MDFVFFTHARSLHRTISDWYHALAYIPAVLTNRFIPHQRAVTLGMHNSYWGYLERVKTLLEMGLVSIDDKDAVSSLAVVHAFHPHSPCPLTFVPLDRMAARCWTTQ